MAAERQMLLSAGRRVTRSALLSPLVGALERASRWRQDLLPVLAYHRVDEPGRTPSLYPGLVSATPEAFEDQMRLLASEYEPIALSDLLDVRAGRARVPARAVLVTFDDAYRDFAKHAWPVLRSLGIPVTLFVPTGFPDHADRAFWWDRLYNALQVSPFDVCETPLGRYDLADAAARLAAYKRIRTRLKDLADDEASAIADEIVTAAAAPPATSAVLGWDELRALAREGVTLAPHSRTHPLLNRVGPERVRAEVHGSRTDLEREVGVTPPAFAYPSGAHDDAVVRALEEGAFEVAFTVMRWGSNDLRRASWLRLRRTAVTRSVTPTVLRAALLPLSTRLATANPDSRPGRGGVSPSATPTRA